MLARSIKGRKEQRKVSPYKILLIDSLSQWVPVQNSKLVVWKLKPRVLGIMFVGRPVVFHDGIKFCGSPPKERLGLPVLRKMMEELRWRMGFGGGS